MNKKLLCTQIKALDRGHGARIVEFYKQQGFDTGNYVGYGDDERKYYGVDHNGLFKNREVINPEQIKTITLEEAIKLVDSKEEKFPFKLELNQAKIIIDAACKNWKEILSEKWGKKLLLLGHVFVDENFYKEMRSNCTTTQHKIFDSIFGPDELKPKLRIPIEELGNKGIVVAVIQNKPCILGKGYCENWKNLTFFAINDGITRGNGYNYSETSDNILKMVERAIHFGGKVETFRDDEWKLALQWLIDNVN